MLQTFVLDESKPILVGMLYQPPEKPRFIEHLDIYLNKSTISHIQECYLMGDFNVNRLSRNKMLLDDSYSKDSPLVKKYINLCFSHSLYQLTAKPTRTTQHTKTLINHILTNSTEKVIQSGVIEMGLSDHWLIYCTRKASLVKLNEYCEICIRSVNNHSNKIFVEK